MVRGKIVGAPDSVHLSDWPEADEQLIDEKLMKSIDTVIKAVELGRAARNKAQLKVRQPLGEIHFFTESSEEKEVLNSLSEQILEELNVKKLTVLNDMNELAVLRVSPNFKALGPSFGKDAQKVAELIKNLDAEQLNSELSKKGSFTIELESDAIEITNEMVTFEHEQTEGISVVDTDGMTAALSTLLTPELIRQGMVRDLVHDINNLRKEADFDVSDRINMYLSMDGELLEAVKEHETYLSNEVLAESIEYNYEGGEISQEIEIQNNKVMIGIERTSGKSKA